MNCKDFENVIHEIVAPRGANPGTQSEALEHASHCLWCALRLDEETKLTKNLRGFRETLRACQAPARVEEALVRAFRDKASGAAANHKPVWLLLRHRLGWTMALAATIAAAWMAFLLAPRLSRHSYEPSPQAAQRPPLKSAVPSPVKATQPSAVVQTEQEVNAQNGQPATQIAARRSLGLGTQDSARRELKSSAAAFRQQGFRAEAARGRATQRMALDTPAPELATDWIPLGACDDPECVDEAVLVRVRLSSEALLMFGIPVDSDYASGPVLADLVLGRDGVPYAIRFVD